MSTTLNRCLLVGIGLKLEFVGTAEPGRAMLGDIDHIELVVQANRSSTMYNYIEKSKSLFGSER